MTEDKPASWYSHPQLLKRTLPCLLPQKGGPFAERMVEDTPFPCGNRKPQGKDLSSVSLTADSSLCGRSLLAASIQSLP